MKSKYRRIMMFLLCSFCVIYNYPYKTSYLNKEMKVDYNDNGIADNVDLVNNARDYIHSGVKYKSKYYKYGYPNDHYGVCTDVIIQAYLKLGINIKEMIDEDIKNYPKAYPQIRVPDPNIDFRRVKNLKTFLDRHATVLTIKCDNPSDFQPGDIIVYNEHIAICSDFRNLFGFPYIIHFTQLGGLENNALNKNINGHYRFFPKN